MLKHMRTTVDAIQQSHSVLVTEGKEGDEEVIISGTTEDVDQTIKILQEASSSILYKTLNVNKPGKRRFLTKGRGTELQLSGIENNHRCIIDRTCTAPSAVSTVDEKAAPVSGYPREHDVFVAVYAESMEDINNTEIAIDEMVAENYKYKTIEHDAVGKLSTEQKKWIHELQYQYDTIIEIEEEIGRIVIRGDANDVLSVVCEIYHQLIEMAKQVEWETLLESKEIATVEGKEIGKGAKQIEWETLLESKEIATVEGKEIGKGAKQVEWETHLESKEIAAVEEKEIGKGKSFPV